MQHMSHIPLLWSPTMQHTSHIPLLWSPTMQHNIPLLWSPTMQHRVIYHCCGAPHNATYESYTTVVEHPTMQHTSHTPLLWSSHKYRKILEELLQSLKDRPYHSLMADESIHGAYQCLHIVGSRRIIQWSILLASYQLWRPMHKSLPNIIPVLGVQQQVLSMRLHASSVVYETTCIKCCL